MQADEEVIRQYLQHKQIAEDFAAYLDLYYKYRDDYGVEEILAGKPRPAAFARLLNAPFDERLSLVSLLLAGLKSRFAESCRQNAVADDCYAMLRQLKQDLAALPDAEPGDPETLLQQQIKDYEAETDRLRRRTPWTRRAWPTVWVWRRPCGTGPASCAGPMPRPPRKRWSCCAATSRRWQTSGEKVQDEAAAALEAAFDFMEDAFGESQEMVVFVTELTVSPDAHTFIAENGCERYFRYNKELLLDQPQGRSGPGAGRGGAAPRRRPQRVRESGKAKRSRTGFHACAGFFCWMNQWLNL